MTTGAFHGNAAVYGTIMSCLGAGSVAGGFFAARRRHHSIRSLAISVTVWGALIIAASLAPNVPIEYVLIAFVGSGAITFNSAAKTLLQVESAPQMRGRVMAVWSIGWQGSTVLGAPIVGGIAALLGARAGLAAGGVAALLIGGFYLVNARVAEPERQPVAVDS